MLATSSYLFCKGKYKSWWYQNRELKQECSAARDIPIPREYFCSEIVKTFKGYFKKQINIHILNYAL